eukprot:PhF_6_TR26669/c1_g3_i3/m.38755
MVLSPTRTTQIRFVIDISLVYMWKKWVVCLLAVFVYKHSSLAGYHTGETLNANNDSTRRSTTQYHLLSDLARPDVAQDVANQLTSRGWAILQLPDSLNTLASSIHP